MVLVATQVKRRRGTNDENDAFAGAEGEITVDLTNKELRVHDGSGKKGGFRIGHYSYTTNCITEIPQDIKLELSSGTLTLKAGSKVYVPNGSGVFNTVTTTQDISVTISGVAGQYYIYKNPGNNINYQSLATIVSGTTDSLAGTPWHVWYDTTNNVINRYTSDGTTPNPGQSFPIAIVTVSGGQITSIDQVFNGIGYIGSIVFTLPGIKALMPNGKNADGTYKNIIINQTNVLTRSTIIGSRGLDVFFTNSGTIVIGSGIRYDIATNTMLSGGNTLQRCAIAKITTTTGGRITSFSSKYVLQAVDYNDTEFIAHQGMPSGRYIDLTLGASGGVYTAPADGYICLRKTGNSDEYIKILNTTSQIGSMGVSRTGGFDIPVTVPVSKGDTFQIAYSASGATNYFRFVYANGSK